MTEYITDKWLDVEITFPAKTLIYELIGGSFGSNLWDGLSNIDKNLIPKLITQYFSMPINNDKINASQDSTNMYWISINSTDAHYKTASQVRNNIKRINSIFNYSPLKIEYKSYMSEDMIKEITLFLKESIHSNVLSLSEKERLNIIYDIFANNPGEFYNSSIAFWYNEEDENES